MATEIKAPLLPESVPDGTILTWYKSVGDTVKMDELLADIETDKVVIEVASPIDGTLTEILKDSGDIIVSNEAIARVEQGSSIGNSETATTELGVTPAATTGKIAELENNLITSPAAKKLIEENRLAAHSIMGSGKGGRVTKEDVLDYIRASSSQSIPQPEIPVASTENTAKGRIEERVPMSRLRAKVADRLLQAVQTTAMLTTFNEANMEAIIDIRTRYKDNSVRHIVEQDSVLCRSLFERVLKRLNDFRPSMLLLMVLISFITGIKILGSRSHRQEAWLFLC